MMTAIACAPVDLGAFRFSAVIDWIEVRVTLAGLSQPRHVRARMPVRWGLPYTTAETEDPSRTARSFTFRLQDPAGPAQFMTDVQAIARPGDPPITCDDVQIIAMEIAFDGYHRRHDRAALNTLAERLLWTQSVWASYPRITADPAKIVVTTETGRHEVKTRPDFFGIATVSKARWALAEGFTLNLGHQPGEDREGGDLTQRTYVKMSDSLDGESYRGLPHDKHRARYEATLRGSCLPFATVGQWQRFRFESLARQFFTWRKWRGAPVPPPAAWLAHFPHLGRMAHQLDRARVAQRRGTRPGTEPDAELNRHALNALRRLTRDQMRPPKR